MRHPLLAPDLRELIVEGDQEVLRDFFEGHHPAESAEMLDDLEAAEVTFVLGLFEPRQATEVFCYLEPEKQDGIAETMDQTQFAQLLTVMSHDERADLVSRLSEPRVEQIMPLLARAEREDIRLLSAYREGTAAGAIMTSDYATLRPDETVHDAIDHLRHEAPNKETIYYCYVVDDNRHLIGFVSLKDLILAPPSRLVSDVMQTDVVSAHLDDDQESVAEKLREYDLIALPIVDSDNRLVGIVTHDDVLDVIVDEATEDVQRLGGMEPLEEGYLDTPFLTLWTKRGVWLGVLFLGGSLTATALAGYHKVFEGVPPLVFFVPLIISAGGNCGSQSATLITRALALGELNPSDWFRVFRHEVLMGLTLGFSLGLLGYGLAWLMPSSFLGDISAVALAGTVSASVATVVIWGNLVGALTPLILKRIGFDPALMSNPMISSLVDVTGIVAYFGIAKWILM
jgi:magnesium transporter